MLASCGIGALRPVREGMHGEMPLSISALRNQSASWPRSASNAPAEGIEDSSARAPMQSDVCPADRNIWIGRPFASARTCSFEFRPPLVRPISRPRPLFEPPGSMRFDAPSHGSRRS